MPSQLFESFAEHFQELQDPRSREGLHEFDDILFLATCATIAGADGPSDIEEFGHHQILWLRRYIRLANGIPSHDTIGRVFELIKPNKFQEAFLNWIHSFRLDEPSNGELTTLAIDGKTERGSRTVDKNPLHVVSAWATEYGLSLGQKAVDSKSNEITAIPELLQTLELRGKIVSIDAMGCQKEIAKNIVQDGGEYCLAVKENQPKLFEAIEAFFEKVADDEQASSDCRQHETNERSRGREEYRHYMIAKLPNEMSEFKKSWHNLTSIGRSLTMVEREGKETVEVRYYILSIEPKVKTFAKSVRDHWGIESMHWIMDVVFQSDASRIHRGHGIENFGFLRRFVISLLKQDTSRASLKCKRKKAAWDTTYLEKLLQIN